MPTVKDNDTSGRDFYDGIYRQDLESEARWLGFAAAQKTRSIEQLLKRNGIKPASLLELGCGTGAVIMECQRRGLASDFTAIDYSKDAVNYLRNHSQGIDCLAADISDPTFELDRSFDVVVLSHVLEHLEEPVDFLNSLIGKVRFRYLVAEVPLEDLPALRLKNRFRERLHNRAGHVQFFTEDSFRSLLSRTPLKAIDSRTYAPVFSTEAVRFVTKRDGESGLRAVARMGTARYLPMFLQPLWTRFYYAHFAVLCSVASGNETGI